MSLSVHSNPQCFPFITPLGSWLVVNMINTTVTSLPEHPNPIFHQFKCPYPQHFPLITPLGNWLVVNMMNTQHPNPIFHQFKCPSPQCFPFITPPGCWLLRPVPRLLRVAVAPVSLHLIPEKVNPEHSPCANWALSNIQQLHTPLHNVLQEGEREGKLGSIITLLYKLLQGW